MDFAAQLLRSGQWLHFFPEGKVVPQSDNYDRRLVKTVRDQELSEERPYRLKWGLARLIIEQVLGEGQNEDHDYPIRSEQSSPIPGSDDSVDSLAEVDVLPIYHVGMDEVLPTRRPYIPRIFRRVIFLVRPEGPIRIDRQFLARLFDDDDKSKSSKTSKMELSLAEKRIRLMQLLEDELNRLGQTARRLQERFQSNRNDDEV